MEQAILRMPEVVGEVTGLSKATINRLAPGRQISAGRSPRGRSPVGWRREGHSRQWLDGLVKRRARRVVMVDIEIQMEAWLVRQEVALADALEREDIADRTCIGQALLAGAILRGVKESLPHGSWGPWLAKVGVADRTARYHIAVANLGLKVSEIVALGGMEAALKEQKTDKAKRQDFQDLPISTDSATPLTTYEERIKALAHDPDVTDAVFGKSEVPPPVAELPEPAYTESDAQYTPAEARKDAQAILLQDLRAELEAARARVRVVEAALLPDDEREKTVALMAERLRISQVSRDVWMSAAGEEKRAGARDKADVFNLKLRNQALEKENAALVEEVRRLQHALPMDKGRGIGVGNPEPPATP